MQDSRPICPIRCLNINVVNVQILCVHVQQLVGTLSLFVLISLFDRARGQPAHDETLQRGENQDNGQ